MNSTLHPAAPAAIGRPHPFILSLLLLAAATCFLHLALDDMSDITEGLRLQPALEMIESGDWVVPRIDGEAYINKPPLTYWIFAGAFKMNGRPSVPAGRLMVALCSFVTVLLTAWAGQRHRSGLWREGGCAGVWAGAMLSASYYFRHKAQTAVIDPILMLALATAIYLFWRAATEQTAAWWRATLGAGVALGAAFMLKGPVIFPFLGAAIAALFITSRPPWRRVLAVAGIMLALATAISLPWCWMLVRRLGWQNVHRILNREVFDRLIHSAPTNTGPITFYLTNVGAAFLPWVLLLLCWLNRPFRETVRREAGEFYRFAAWFTLLSFVIFSLIKGKETAYLMPIFPYLALLLGLALDWLIRREGEQAGLWQAAARVMVIFMVAGCLAPAALLVPRARALLGPWDMKALLVAAALASAATLAILRQGRRRAASLAFILALGLGLIVGMDAFRIRNDQKKSPRLLAERLAGEARRGAMVYRWKIDWPNALWYARQVAQPLPASEALREAAARAERPMILLAPVKNGKLKELLTEHPEIDLGPDPKPKYEQFKYGIYEIRVNPNGTGLAAR